MKRYLSIQRIGVFALLFSMLLLPMLHLHPAENHLHGETETHSHQLAVHADFFPAATHGHEPQEGHDQHDTDLSVSIIPAQHTLSQVDLLSLHVGRSLQAPSVFKRHPVAIGQDLSDLPVFSHFQRGMPIQDDDSPGLNIQFSPPSLRAPPFFA